MRKSRQLASSIALAIALAIGAGVPFTTSAHADVTVAQGRGMTLEQAIEQVKRQYGGRIVSANTVVQGGREVHVVRVLTREGNVKTVRVPGRSRGRA